MRGTAGPADLRVLADHTEALGGDGSKIRAFADAQEQREKERRDHVGVLWDLVTDLRGQGMTIDELAEEVVRAFSASDVSIEGRVLAVLEDFPHGVGLTRLVALTRLGAGRWGPRTLERILGRLVEAELVVRTAFVGRVRYGRGTSTVALWMLPKFALKPGAPRERFDAQSAVLAPMSGLRPRDPPAGGWGLLSPTSFSEGASMASQERALPMSEGFFDRAAGPCATIRQTAPGSGMCVCGYATVAHRGAGVR